jgi:hypothetical protein
MRACLAYFCLVLLALPMGCQRLPGTEEDDDSGPSHDDTTGFATLLPGNSDDAVVDEETGATGVCDPVSQTGCAMGQKCTAIVSGGLVVYTCAVAPGGLGPNEACMASPADGIDGCPAGYACLADEAGAGLCAPLCEGDGDCDQSVCIPARETDIPYCADDCSPFASACAAPLACRRNGNRFSCTFLAVNDVGGEGDGCAPTDDAGCAPGLVCLPGALIPECAMDNCCTPLCDTTEANPCVSPSSCLPILSGAAPGFESIGACFVPA